MRISYIAPKRRMQTGVELKSNTLIVDISNVNCSFNGDDLYSCLMSGSFNHVTAVELFESRRYSDNSETYCSRVLGINGFAALLLLVLQCCKQMESLVLNRINTASLFFYLPRHPISLDNYNLNVLKIKYMAVSEEDMISLGPCFTSVKHLVW